MFLEVHLVPDWFFGESETVLLALSVTYWVALLNLLPTPFSPCTLQLVSGCSQNNDDITLGFAHGLSISNKRSVLITL